MSFFQQLTNKFRLDYARFWTTVLRSDVEGLKHYSEVLGVGPLYGLFACMVTGRSWEAITEKGISQESTKGEVRCTFLSNDLINFNVKSG